MGIKKIFSIKYVHRFEELFAFAAIFLLALFPTMEVIARKFFHTGLKNSTVYTSHLVLLITFVGAMITAREKKHLSLALDLKLKGGLKTGIEIANAFISAAMTTAFALASFSFALTSFAPGKQIGAFSVKLIVMVMFVGFAVMAIRFINAVPAGKKARLLAAMGILYGCLFAFDPIINSLLTFFAELPGFLLCMQEFYHSLFIVIIPPVIILLILSVLLGQPIFIVLGGVGYLLFVRAIEPLEVIPNEAYSMLISQTVPAIPLFTIVGFILSESKAGERLVRLFKSLFSWFPGGLGIMAIMVCTFFTTFTGASGVTILALGALLSYVLVKGKYKQRFTFGLLTSVGSIGLLFPPSLPIIIYGIAAGVSIKDMFIGGIVPGIVMVLAMVIFVIIYSTRAKVERAPFHLKEALSAFKKSFWEILLPLVILVSYFGGLTTLVESGAIAVLYALIIEVVIHRDIKIRDLPGVVLKGIPIIGGVLIILALAKGFSYYIVDAEIPQKLTDWVQASIGSKYVFLLILNFVLLITGCLMDIFSAIMVVVPLILPLGALFGIDPVHLGIIFLANMELGYLTPPVGLNLFLASYRFNEPMSKIYRDVLPFLLIQLISVLLITYVPFLSTGLLNLIK